jgi:prepilin-type N-terminal cleavage/methylation domain-containing protein
MAGRERKRGRSPSQAGVSLLEVLVAISLLGLGFAAVFSGFSASLRTIGRVEHYARVMEFARNKLNEVLIDPNIGPGEDLAGVSDPGLRWYVRTSVADERRGASEGQSVQLIRIEIVVSWDTAKGTQTFALQTLKLHFPSPAAKVS